MRLTKWQLIELLFQRVGSRFNRWTDDKGRTGILLSIEREDGSGKCFNVTFKDDETGKNLTCFVTTVD